MTKPDQAAAALKAAVAGLIDEARLAAEVASGLPLRDQRQTRNERATFAPRR